jgi:hypothetical protein
VTFIFVTNSGPELGWAGSKLFYDDSETSWIASICDDFAKLSYRLICDAQYMVLLDIITYVFF